MATTGLKNYSTAILVIITFTLLCTALFCPISSALPTRRSTPMLPLINVAAQLPTSPSDNNWPMFRGNPTRSGYLTNTTIVTTGWNYSTYNPISSSPAIANGLVYIKGEQLLCINASTGTKIWESTVNMAQEFLSPVVCDGYVYVCSDFRGVSSNVYAFNAATGKQIWSSQINNSASTPAVFDGVLYIGSNSGKAYALNAQTGKMLWKHNIGSEINSSPTVDNNMVYIEANDGKTYALDASTGKEVWNHTTGIEVKYPRASSPAVDKGVLYIGSNNNGVYALNASTGEEIWHFSLNHAVLTTPAVSDNTVVILTHAGIYAINANSGIEVWKFKTSPEFLPNGHEASSPAIAKGIAYVNSYDYNLYALNVSTGEKIGNFTIVEPKIDALTRVSSPAVSNGIVYVSIDRTLFAIPESTFIITPNPSSEPASIFIYMGITGTILGLTAIAIIILKLKHKKVA
ncbi:PQQ-binding-like beta-propeller repeat protein [Candidatus Bathycorpusculum sp.]|uniref:outer membrane protein assembly factor BamB family protein n=1 Tax=Candidatus Bathycorpusculum sp. TaxID=2994959 RepID=UPI002819F6E1|nr:PQQ-binding-like beta-propeller repeat protein [Candidatus Termitimicrobium sp.]MCL2685738.1 PQQ-binding-like beta-propeller repeat protein [Candidatus Termitimicrobium sp.]